jgi:pimeloyl-ACP methyl ester carboxylesterase
MMQSLLPISLVLTACVVFGAEAQLGDINIHYESTGQGPTAVVLIHGWTCDHTFWRLNAPALTKQRRVLAIDLPGHGKSSKPQIGYTMSLFARAVEAVMRQAKVDRAVLVGHSMGVPVIRQFHREFPGKVTGLVMVDGGVPRDPGTEEARRRAASRFTGDDFKETASKAIDSMFVEATTPALREEIKQKMLATPRHVMASAYAEIFEPSTRTLDRVEAPVLFVFARRTAPPSDQEQFLRGLFPKLAYEPMDGVGHFLMMEQPERFNRILLEFLEKHNL